MVTNATPLNGHRLVLGVTGSIAAYKSAELLRLLVKDGADVQVIMSREAARFIGPLTMATLSKRQVLSELFPDADAATSWTQHVSLGLWADLIVIAPATAQTIARLAHGFADTLLAASVLSARCPVLVCPAMDRDMYAHAAVQANLDALHSFGYRVLPASHGELASGLTGQGRLPEPDAIFDAISSLLRGRETPLSGRTALVTAGPTREPLDPVRVLTNHSTGAMGYALARALARRGAQVTLVSGPTALSPPRRLNTVSVSTAEEMRQVVLQHAAADIVIMAAAVSDFAAAQAAEQKIKKQSDLLQLTLRRTPDILQELGQRRNSGQVLVGFAMETENGLEHARRKLREKNLDWIALNYTNRPGEGFGTGTNRITLLSRTGAKIEIPTMEKDKVAEALLESIFTGPA